MQAFLRRTPPQAFAYGLLLLLIIFAVAAARGTW
jgi:hypothetical protein